MGRLAWLSQTSAASSRRRPFASSARSFVAPGSAPGIRCSCPNMKSLRLMHSPAAHPPPRVRRLDILAVRRARELCRLPEDYSDRPSGGSGDTRCGSESPAAGALPFRHHPLLLHHEVPIEFAGGRAGVIRENAEQCPEAQVLIR